MAILPGIIYNQLFVSLPEPTEVQPNRPDSDYHRCEYLAWIRSSAPFAVRSLDKGKETQRRIESTGRRGAVDVWGLDLSSCESVKIFARSCDSDLPRLDCVIENAALGPHSYVALEDNEAALTVNVVSTFLLGTLLLPLCRKTAHSFNTQPRLTFIVSDVHGMAHLPERHQPNVFAALNADKSVQGIRRRYEVTKLLGVILTRELASRVGEPGNHGAEGRRCGFDHWPLFFDWFWLGLQRWGVVHIFSPVLDRPQHMAST
ncbi:hypothetical protein QBC33DRAFT_519069 [Phialemonium atrogriseum]|uniref:Ketoreductase (KR) domain-containing protein n=1 Tax=Phialemonium atrogriseum TaxID=1093897 RepID=A0AAJ0BS64_9PEZI|nr:uncharacterized protein QBC33DRAFT_519069 [Phialemonium atrogriseum]KAK1763067.1 hypothetical protein QBC33DRAFT_519069 [Phialemonium atrogriseum]